MYIQNRAPMRPRLVFQNFVLSDLGAPKDFLCQTCKMKPFPCVVCTLLIGYGQAAWAQTWTPAPGFKQIPIWPGTPPNAKPMDGPEVNGFWKGTTIRGRVVNVSKPTMTIYPAKGKNTGATMIVFPGGGYQMLAMDLEGTEICDYFTARGITCVLLKYRVPDSGPTRSQKLKRTLNPKPAMALQDAQRTIGLLRQNAKQWNIDPHKIGVIGFSAGGHLVASISNNWAKRIYPAIDAADKQSCRPDFAISLYPGHLWMDKRKFELNLDITVTRKTPPTFLLHAEDDPIDHVNHSLVYYVALKKAGVPVEMHLYAHGGHAFGLRPTKFPITRWPDLALSWLRNIGMAGR